jgi:hypothetical protein
VENQEILFWLVSLTMMGITLFRYADLVQELEESCVNDVESLIGLSFFNHTADVDLTRSL